MDNFCTGILPLSQQTQAVDYTAAAPGISCVSLVIGTGLRVPVFQQPQCEATLRCLDDALQVDAKEYLRVDSPTAPCLPRILTDFHLSNALKERLSKLPVDADKLLRMRSVAKVAMEALDRIKDFQQPSDRFVIDSITQMPRCCLDSIRPDDESIEFIVVLHSVTSTATIALFADRLMEELPDITGQPQIEVDHIQLPDAFNGPIVRVYLTVLMENIAETPMPFRSYVAKNWYSIYRAIWFERDVRPNLSCGGLIAVLLDIRRRFDHLGALTPWMVTVLSEFASRQTFDNTAHLVHLPLEVAFRRLLKFLANGGILPDREAILDPIDSKSSITCDLSFFAARKITSVMRTLHGLVSTSLMGTYQVMGLVPDRPLRADLQDVAKD